MNDITQAIVKGYDRNTREATEAFARAHVAREEASILEQAEAMFTRGQGEGDEDFLSRIAPLCVLQQESEVCMVLGKPLKMPRLILRRMPSESDAATDVNP